MKNVRLVCVIFLFLFCACQHELPLPPKPSVNDILFREVAPIFTTNCVLSGCHDLTTRQVGLALDSHQNLIRGSFFGEVVIPFAPEKSVLMDMLTGRGIPRMPLGRAPLDSLDILRLSEWIRQGARDDSGRVPFDDNKPRLYVAHQKGGLVSIVDFEGLQVARVAQTGNLIQSSELAVCNDASFWYVSDRRLRDWQNTKTVPTGGCSRWMCPWRRVRVS